MPVVGHSFRIVAFVCACVRACVRACVHACVHMYVRTYSELSRRCASGTGGTATVLMSGRAVDI